MPGTCSSDITATEGVGETEFDMLTSDIDVAIERALALPEFVLPEEDDIVKATTFRCRCKSNNGDQCCSQFSPKEMVAKRMDMMEMTPRDQMLVLLGKLSCGINLLEKTCSSHRSQDSLKIRKRHRTTYMIEGRHICVNTFKFLHPISANRLSSLQKWYRCKGLQPKEKRNPGRDNNARAYSFEDIKRTVALVRFQMVVYLDSSGMTSSCCHLQRQNWQSSMPTAWLCMIRSTAA